MSIAGNLRTMELAELLQWLSQSKKTGTLVVDNNKVKKQIFFNEGRVFSSASTDPREHLGAFLVSHGFITELELGQAVKMQESNKMLLGKILTTVGAISEEDLHGILRLKAEEAIFDVFTWPEGDFRFLDQKLPDTSKLVSISLDVAAIVMEGMQRLDEWKLVREAIPSADCVPVVVAPFEQNGLPQGASAILGLIDDDRSVGDIARKLRAHEFHVSRVLLSQVTAGSLKIVRPRRQAGGGGSPDAPPLQAVGEISGEALLEIGRKFLEEQELDAALRHARAARALEPENTKVATGAQKIEDRLRQELDQAGIYLDAVPVLAAPMEELSRRKLSPQQGFVLTRIDGVTDLGSLIKLGPAPPLDTHLLFWQLQKDEVIRLESKRR